MTSSRREFLKTAGAIAAASVLPSRVSRADGTGPAPLQQFGYGEVELLEGPLRHQFDTNHAFYGAMDEDALLKPFRQRADMPAPGDDMGGWYSWAPLSDLDKPGQQRVRSGPQLRAVSLRAVARLRGHRQQGHAGKGASAGAQLRARHHAALLGRQSLPGLHLRQDLHRHARCAPVRRRARCAEGAGQDARFGVGSSAAAAASRARSSTSGRTRMSPSAGMSLTRCRKTRSSHISAARAIGTRNWGSGFWPTTGTGIRSPTGKTCCPTSTPTVT